MPGELLRELEKLPINGEYSRLITFRIEDGRLQVLVQVLDNDLVVYPGGRLDVEVDKEPMDALLREISEEGSFDDETLNLVKDYFLSGSTLQFTQDVIYINKNGVFRENYFVTPYNDSLNGLLMSQDPEIASVDWTDMIELSMGEGIEGIIPDNIKKATTIAMRYLDLM